MRWNYGAQGSMKQIEGIWLPDGDTHFEAHLKAGPRFEDAGTYQFRKIELAISACAEDRRRTAIDVGAHVGLWSRVLARYFEHVEAFEPVPEHIECLKKNTEAFNNITITPFAASDRTGEILFNSGSDNSGNACAAKFPSDITSSVEGVRLDDEAGWCVNIDLIKIDVEGYEIRVVRGAEQIIKDQKPVVVIEQKPGNAERYGYAQHEARDLLLSWGMRVLWERSGDFCLGW